MLWFADPGHVMTSLKIPPLTSSKLFEQADDSEGQLPFNYGLLVSEWTPHGLFFLLGDILIGLKVLESGVLCVPLADDASAKKKKDLFTRLEWNAVSGSEL